MLGFRGLRVTVSLVLNLVADGMTADEIVDSYPYLSRSRISTRRCATPLGWRRRTSSRSKPCPRHEIPARYGNLSEGRRSPQGSWS